MNAVLPTGFAVRLGRDVRSNEDRSIVLGGAPARVLRLRPEAARLLAREPLVVDDARSGALARMLVDRGLAHPQVRPQDRRDEVTVVVPVRDRTFELDRLLRSLPRTRDVVVVDDGSRDATALAAVVSRHGARLVRREESGGPAAARNTGLRHVRTRFVAFVDSDVDAQGPWLDVLLAHFDDPKVGVVAPRVLGLAEATGSWVARYEAVRSSLDLGPEPALVRPGSRVSYVPSACLVARTDVLGDGFDPTMPVAEDVDLVWRTAGAGVHVRYEPAATVRHDHRVDARSWLRRKAFYGTGAALLAERHGSAVAPAVVAPWSVVAVGAVAAQRWWSLPVAAASSVVAGRRLVRRLPQVDDPVGAGVRLVGAGLVATAWQTGSLLTRHWWPVAAVACVRSSRVRRLVAVAAVAEGVADARRQGRTAPRELAEHVVAHRLDDLAYGVGLWWGCVRSRSVRALLPRRT